MIDKLTGEQLIAILSLFGLLILGHFLLFEPLPASNATLLATIVGALATNLTVVAGKKALDVIKSSGPDAVINTNSTTP